MKQEEKKQQSRKKIIDSALQEFGEKTYTEASINTICKNGNISKGIIYHYFKDKDELFLTCVKDCFDTFVDYLKKGELEGKNNQDDVQAYLHMRYRFFQENSCYSNIFFNTVLQPPKHLMKEIKELRKELDALNLRYYENMVNQITLKDGVTKNEAVEYFYIFQEMFNSYFQSKAYEETDFHTLVAEHELKLSKIFNIMLYGIAKENDNK